MGKRNPSTQSTHCYACTVTTLTCSTMRFATVQVHAQIFVIAAFLALAEFSENNFLNCLLKMCCEVAISLSHLKHFEERKQSSPLFLLCGSGQQMRCCSLVHVCACMHAQVHILAHVLCTCAHMCTHTHRVHILLSHTQ